MGGVGGAEPAQAGGEGARTASLGGWRGVTWPWKGLGVGARVEGQPEVRLGRSFVPLGSVRETKGEMLNGGCECRVEKCE